MTEASKKDRRSFLKFAALAAPAAAAAVVANPAAAATPEGPRLSDRGDACMQDTDHTRRYYELARF